jgi:hypothetical protein
MVSIPELTLNINFRGVKIAVAIVFQWSVPNAGTFTGILTAQRLPNYTDSSGQLQAMVPGEIGIPF